MPGDLMHMLYGPLPKGYCSYFYFLQVIGFLLMVFALGAAVFSSMKRGGGGKDRTMASLVLAMTYGLMYFTNRLMYSMCVNSLH